MATCVGKALLGCPSGLAVGRMNVVRQADSAGDKTAVKLVCKVVEMQQHGGSKKSRQYGFRETAGPHSPHLVHPATGIRNASMPDWADVCTRTESFVGGCCQEC